MEAKGKSITTIKNNLKLSSVSPSTSFYEIMPTEANMQVILPKVGNLLNEIRQGCDLGLCNLSSVNSLYIFNHEFTKFDIIEPSSTTVYTADTNDINGWVFNSTSADVPEVLVSQSSNSFSFNPGYLLPNFGKLGFQVDRFLSPDIVLNTSNSVITINSSGRYSFRFWCNLLVDDSSTSYSLFLRKSQPQSVSYTRVITPKLQPGSINGYSTCTMEALVDVNSKDQFIIYVQRNSGSGNVIVNTSIEAYLDVVKVN